MSAALCGFALAIYLLIGLNSGIAAAATIGTAQADDQALVHPECVSPLESAVDHYLSSIPADYYALGTVGALKNLMGDSTPFLIDVRSSSEYKAGHIAGAINIPLQELDRHLDAIPTNREVVLYCSTGYRSAMGVMALRLQGFTDVKGFPPSFAGWKAAGEPVSLSERLARPQP